VHFFCCSGILGTYPSGNSNGGYIGPGIIVRQRGLFKAIFRGVSVPSIFIAVF